MQQELVPMLIAFANIISNNKLADSCPNSYKGEL